MGFFLETWYVGVEYTMVAQQTGIWVHLSQHRDTHRQNLGGVCVMSWPGPALIPSEVPRLHC